MTDIEEILTKITASPNQTETFCSKTQAPSNSLPIGVKGFPYGGGKLKFPLSVRASKALIKLAKPAKFGWKDQTLLDKEVRDAWEIPKSKISIDKRQWNLTLNPVLEQLGKQLNLPEGARLKAHLHNMLVYETGQFFAAHQDS